MNTNKRTAFAGFLIAVVALSGCGDQTDPGPTDQAADTHSDLPGEITMDRGTVEISNAMSGWLHTGLDIKSGDSVALFATGAWEVDGLIFQPRHMLWYRIGDNGTAWNFAADQEFFVADSEGELSITLRPIGVYWDDARGTYPPGFSQAPPVPVQTAVEAVRFQRPLEAGLRALAEAGDANAQAALKTLASQRALPDGFFYLPYLGRSNVWAAGSTDGRNGIQAQTTDDVGIVKLPLDIPLTEDTRFSFEWRYDALPALGPETEAQFHDYLSIALEFDNGQDLTWMWSPELEAGIHFGCPLPWWDSRETHYVLTGGQENLGTWESHTRAVLADYRESIKVAEPTRIVGIWFIANSIFGRQPGAASFANVSIGDGESTTVVFAD